LVLTRINKLNKQKLKKNTTSHRFVVILELYDKLIAWVKLALSK